MQRHRLGAMSLVCALGLATAAPAPIFADEPAIATFDDADALLDALEKADDAIDALWCQVVYDRRFVLQGDQQIRLGELAYQRSGEGDDVQRAFEVEFTTLLLGPPEAREQREDRQSWTFKDRWLVERRFADKVYVKRELAPEGATIDPLRLGQGPMPLPLGQRKDDITARYRVAMTEAAEGFDDEDPTDDAYERFVVGHDRFTPCAQLVLTPRADTEDRDERFREIRLWYRPDTEGGLIPVLSRTEDRSGDIVFVQLVGVHQAERLPADRAITLDEPPEDAGWDVRIERGRFDEDLDSVRIGAAYPTSTVEFATYAHPTVIGDPPTDTSGEVGGIGDFTSDATTADEVEPAEAPDISPVVIDAIGARWLTDAERAQRRVFHGIWTASDLENVPGATAKAALNAGVWDHPAFDDDPFTDPLDRIEAMVRRGDLASALEEIGPEDERVRAQRLRGEALAGLGRFEDAIGVLEPLRAGLSGAGYDNAKDTTEAARASWIVSRLTGENAEIYKTMMGALTDAHQRMDRLYWPAIVTEAQLLESKGNAEEAVQAAMQTLSVSLDNADAWALLGERSVKGFNVEGALGVSARLDRVERRIGGRNAFSATGDLVAARMYLRLNDPEMAERRVERVLERYPRHREALALRCAIAATRYDYALLEEHLSAFDQLSPGHPLALFEAGSALSERRQYARAAEYLNRAVERMPTWAEPVVELGLMEVQAGRDVIARDVLKRAVELDPFHTRALNSLALVEGLLDEFATVESDHFIVRYKPGPDEIMANEMLDDLEEMHDLVVERMGYEPERKTLVEVMPDHAWFSVRITGMPQIHTVAAATGPIIAMEAPKVGKRHTGVYDWLRVVRHEYTHTVTLARTENRIPLWFTEAAAVEMELAPRDYDTVRLLAGALEEGRLFNLEEIDLGFIRPRNPGDRSQAYAQANWMWRFIDATWGNDKNLEMMDRFARGERIPQVLDEMFGITQREFMERFEAWAWDDAQAWGVFAEPSLEALLLEETQADPVLGEGLRAELSRFARDASRATVTDEAVEPLDARMVRPSPDLVDFWSQLYPDHPDVLRLMVEEMLEERLGDPTPEDAPLLERYAKARPTDPLPHRHLARLYLRSGEPAKAVPHLEYLDAREVYSPAYTVALARRYAEEGRYEDALRAAEKAVRIAPFDGDYRELAATVALRLNDYATALHHIEALTVLEPAIEQHKRRLDALRALMERDEASAG